MAAIPSSDEYWKDPNLSLREKWNLHVQKKKTAGASSKPTRFLHTWGPRGTLYVLVGAGGWTTFVVIPTLYQGGWENYILPAQILMGFLLLEVAVNWCLARWVSSKYRPELHGTMPSVPKVELDFQTCSGPDTKVQAFAPSGSDSVLENGETSCAKRSNGEFATGTDTKGNESASEVQVFDLDYAPPTKDGAYDGYSYRMLVATSLPNEDGHVERRSVPYWSWVTCVVCQRPRPPRCHHCPLCKACVLKRDHHCYFTGSCVGVNNQRFFHMFVFWAIPLTTFATMHMFPYASRHVGPEYGAGPVDFIFPVCVIRCLFGYVSFVVVFLCSEFWLLLFCTFTSISMTISHLHLFCVGRTSFERDNSIKVSDTRSLSGKLLSVFGKYWWLNFLVPLYPRFKPVEDAVLWPHIKP